MPSNIDGLIVVPADPAAKYATADAMFTNADQAIAALEKASKAIADRVAADIKGQ